MATLQSKRPTTPKQQEVDSLAAFIEAAEELQQEPFFRPDEKRTMGHDGKTYYYNLGDRFHFRSALVSFRRIWLTEEASNFYKIINVIRKYNDADLCVQMWVPMIRQEHQRIENGAVVNLPELNTKELVDLWLNAVFAHNNIAQKGQSTKRLDRIDFERFAHQIDRAAFEYSFRMAIWRLGLCYRNLLNCVAKPILAVWKARHGLSPSFEIGFPFGLGAEEITKEGTRIIRRASTEYSVHESLEQKFSRLLSRHEFNQFGNVLKALCVSNMPSIIMQATSYEDVLSRCGFEVERVGPIDANAVLNQANSPFVWSIIPCHAPGPLPDFYSVIYANKRVLTEDGAIKFFGKKFHKIKALMSQSTRA